MNKLVKIGMVALTAVGFSGTTVTANAATWHKGLPKFVQNKKYKTKLKMGEGTWAKMTKTQMFMKYTQGDPTPRIKYAKYQKLGKTYLVKGKYRNWLTDKKLHTHYYRIRKISTNKIKISDGRRGKLLTMTRVQNASNSNLTWW